MFKSKLKGFILKRVMILYALLSVLDMLLIRERWFVLAGLTSGALYSTVRFVLLDYTFTTLLSGESKSLSIGRTIFAAIGSFMVLIAVLIVSIKLSTWMFIGTVSGISLVPVVIVLNGITEALGISHNNFK